MSWWSVDSGVRQELFHFAQRAQQVVKRLAVRLVLRLVLCLVLRHVRYALRQHRLDVVRVA